MAVAIMAVALIQRGFIVKSEIKFSGQSKVQPIDRFWQKVQKREDGCWIWRGTQNKKEGPTPYGHFYDGEKIQSAHRFSYQVACGPISQADHLHHTCRNTLCVNPAHLVVTNNADHVRTFHSAAPKSATRTGIPGRKTLMEKGFCTAGHPMTGKNVVTTRNQVRCRVCIEIRSDNRLQRAPISPEMQGAVESLIATFSPEELKRISLMIRRKSSG